MLTLRDDRHAIDEPSAPPANDSGRVGRAGAARGEPALAGSGALARAGPCHVNRDAAPDQRVYRWPRLGTTNLPQR